MPVTLALLLALAARSEPLLEGALGADDQCVAGDCGLNALQLRAAKQAPSEEAPVDSAGNASAELGSAWWPGYYPSWQSSGHHHSSSCGCCCHHEEKISDVWATCADRVNSCCHSCGIWSAQHTAGKHSGGGHGAAYVGEKVVPTSPIGGMEGITPTTAASYDYLWGAAAHKTHYSSSMALIANPWMSRTQHQLHILTKPLDGRGQNVVKRLESITKCAVGDWQHAHLGLCHYSKAKLFHGLPNVFSEVVGLALSNYAMGRLVSNPQGELTLASVGVTVLFICGGKPVVLATGNGDGGCSIEHSIA